METEQKTKDTKPYIIHEDGSVTFLPFWKMRPREKVPVQRQPPIPRMPYKEED